MDAMRQHISLSRRLNNIVKPRLCNMAAERYRQSKRPRGSNEPEGASVCQKTFEASYFTPKPSQFSCHCEAAARPWQSESQRYVIPHRSTGARNKREALSQKTWDSLRRFASSFFILRFCFVSCNHISFRNDKSQRQRLLRRAQRMRPPRNDRIGRLDRKHGTQNPIFGIRKNVSYLLIAFDGSGLS